MHSVAVRDLGIVLLRSPDTWRIYAPTTAQAQALANTVNELRATLPQVTSIEMVADVLLALADARLLSVPCTHGPGDCENAVR